MQHELRNILTVDIEEYFHSPAFDSLFGADKWPSLESRVTYNTERMLEILKEYSVTATFFILGWVAERFPDIINKIKSKNHEIACHGYSHRFVYKLTPAEFKNEVVHTINILNDLGIDNIKGYRAPAFTITENSLWALDILAEMGFQYDASIYPIYRPRYGIPSSNRFIHQVKTTGRDITEIPASTIRLIGRNWPVAGGGYFRLYPYPLTRWAIENINKEGHPAVVYIHPWELDPGQPKLKPDPKNRFTHYVRLGSTEDKFRKLLSEFQFGPIRDFIEPDDSA